MRRASWYRIVDRWLKENRSRFICLPYLLKGRNKHHASIKFLGCKNYLEVCLSSWGSIDVMVFYSGDGRETSDLLCDFDYSPQRNSPAGFYCDLCHYTEDGGTKPVEQWKYYKSKKELIIEHSLEPMLKWCNEFIRQGSQILFYEFGAKIIREGEEEVSRYPLWFRYPIGAGG